MSFVFMTGATGFLGSYFVQSLLRDGNTLFLLVRAQDLASAREKLARSLRKIGGVEEATFESRVHICLGSLERPGLGLQPEDRARIVADCDEFLHCGATVRFDLPLEEARATNVEGTRSVLELALERQGQGKPVRRFDYVGTAFVAGRRTDCVLETELDGSLGHKNTYERTKFEAEQLVRAHQDRMPIAIHRPSIITGESSGGRTSSFKMIYWPARVYALGLWRTCPGRPATPIDLVPVDFVRDAILALRGQPASLGRCFHLTAGPQGCVTLGQITELIQKIFEVRKPVRFVEPTWWMRYVHPLLRIFAFGPSRRVVKTGEFYVPYFTQNPLFDNRGTVELLEGSGLSLPRVEDYIQQLFRYCIDTDWGRKALPA